MKKLIFIREKDGAESERIEVSVDCELSSSMSLRENLEQTRDALEETSGKMRIRTSTVGNQPVLILEGGYGKISAWTFKDPFARYWTILLAADHELPPNLLANFDPFAKQIVSDARTDSLFTGACRETR